MELRQRRAPENNTQLDVPQLVNKLKSFDVYPKTLDDFKEKTSTGAAVSLVSCLVILVLFLSELSSYLRSETVDHLYVDTSTGQKLRINLNITFPSLACSGLSLDVMDVSGDQQIDVAHNVYKRRISKDGVPIKDSLHPASGGGHGECGRCFPKGMENPEGKCCNTCQEVKRAHAAKGLPHNIWKEAPQCSHDAQMIDPSKMVQGEGCDIFGYLEVNKVAGNFHFAPGKSFQHAQGQHVHEFKPFEAHLYNVSHTIHSLSFGAHYPNRVNPLDNLSRILVNGSGVYQYFVKVVPTIYQHASGLTITTNQYSVTDHFKGSGDPKSGFVLPGAFFIYDLSPIMVKFTEKRKSFSHFMTGVCAIVGGVFTVAGLIDSIIYHTARSLEKKSTLGKAT